MHPNEYAKVKAGEILPQPSLRVDVQSATTTQTNVSPRGPPADDDDVLLNSRQVRARVGSVSDMCIWRWCRNPAVAFPAPVKIGTSARNYWRLGDLRRWQAEHVTPKAA